jgi:hypothetical protein
MILEAKHWNFKSQYEDKERVLTNVITGSTCLYKLFLNYISFRQF